MRVGAQESFFLVFAFFAFFAIPITNPDPSQALTPSHTQEPSPWLLTGRVLLVLHE